MRVASAGEAGRRADLSSGRTAENARFFDLPAPSRVHILGATAFLVPGAFQFMSSLRRTRPRWHRWSGRILVPAGIAGALSGPWMAAFSDLPVHDHAALMWLRLLFGSLMTAGLVLALVEQPGGNLEAAGIAQSRRRV